MLEKLKNSGKMPLVIGIGATAVAIIVITIAIIVGININKAKETNLSDINNQEEIPTDENGNPIIIDMGFEDEEEEQPEEEQPGEEQTGEEPEEQPKEETPKVDSKYFIRVNYGANVVTIYTLNNSVDKSQWSSML